MKKRYFYVTIILSFALILIGLFYFNKFFLKEEEETTTEKLVIKEYTKHYDVLLISKESKNKDYEQKFIKYQNELEGVVRAYEEGGEKPSPDFFIEKARYAEYLDQTDWAIEILNRVFDYYSNSSVAWNNLAKLYEDKKDYVKANEYYQKILDTFTNQVFYNNFYSIAKNYMIMDNKEEAREYYQKFKNYGGFDERLEDYLNNN